MGFPVGEALTYAFLSKVQTLTISPCAFIMFVWQINSALCGVRFSLMNDFSNFFLVDDNPLIP